MSCWFCFYCKYFINNNIYEFFSIIMFIFVIMEKGKYLEYLNNEEAVKFTGFKHLEKISFEPKE